MQKFLRSMLAVLLLACGSTASAAIPEGLTGTLIVLNKSGHNASFIDLASGDLLATLPTGQGPHELVVTSDGHWAIGTDYAGGNSLTVFDVENLRIARTIDLSAYPRPHGILLLPGEREVVVTSEASQNLVVVDFHSGEILRALSTGNPGSHMVALSRDGSLAFTSNGASNNVSVVDMALGQLQRAIPVPQRPEAITVNAAGTLVWVGSNDEQVVSLVDAQSGQIHAQWQGFSWPYRILLNRAERLAVIPDLRTQNLRFFDVASREEVGVMDFAGADPQGVVLYKDDKTLFLSLSAQDKVAVVDIESRRLLGEYLAGDAPDGIGYSPLVTRRVD